MAIGMGMNLDTLFGVTSRSRLITRAAMKKNEQIAKQCWGRAENPSTPRIDISRKITAYGALKAPSGLPISKADQ